MISDDDVRGGQHMQQIIFAMFAAGLILAVRDMAKIAREKLGLVNDGEIMFKETK